MAGCAEGLDVRVTCLGRNTHAVIVTLEKVLTQHSQHSKNVLDHDEFVKIRSIMTFDFYLIQYMPMEIVLLHPQSSSGIA